MKPKPQVLEQTIATMTEESIEYICITDIAKYRNSARSDDLIRNWLRNRNTIKFLGIWEQLNNSNFNPVEFDRFKKEAGLNSFTLTPKQWREQNPSLSGNMRDRANIHQLVCLANMESMNAYFFQQGIKQSERIVKLNQLAIQQMQVLIAANTTKNHLLKG